MRFLPRALSVVLITCLVLLGLPGSAWAAVASRTTSSSTSTAPSYSAPSSRAPAKLSAKSRTGAQPGTETRSLERTPAQKPAPQGFSEEQRKRYAEKDKNDKKSDNYKGGVTLIIGGGVLVVALLIVLIIVLVD